METYRRNGLLTITVIVITSFISVANAHAEGPGIRGTSNVDGVKFTWVIISSDNEISINLRYVGQGTTPDVTVVATALTNNSQDGGTSTMAGSQFLNAGWVSPNSVTLKLEGGSSLYDADHLTVVASPYGSNNQPNTSPSTINDGISSLPSTSESATSNSPGTESNSVFLVIPNVHPPKSIFHRDWAQINNTSIIKGSPTSSILGSEPAPVYLAGIIKNVGNETQFKVKLIISLFDMNDNLIGVEDGTPEIQTLNVNDITPYKVKVNGNISSLDHYIIQFDVCDKSHYECNV